MPAPKPHGGPAAIPLADLWRGQITSLDTICHITLECPLVTPRASTKARACGQALSLVTHRPHASRAARFSAFEAVALIDADHTGARA
jgi:hypothetical protein